MLSERVSGCVILLAGGLFGAGMIIIRVHGLVAGKSGGVGFVRTLLSLGTTASRTRCAPNAPN